jgi:hypothetical protein
MASEIIAVRSKTEAVGEKKWSLLYLYPLATPITDASGTRVIYQTATALPAEISASVPAASKSAITAGDMLFQVHNVVQTPGETDAAFLGRLRAHYAACMSHYVDQIREQFARTGQAFNAT